MPQQFESDPSIYSQTTVAEAPATSLFDTAITEQEQQISWYRHRTRAVIAAGSMVLATVGAGIFAAETAEASALNGDVFSPTASNAEKVLEVDALAHRGLVGWYKGPFKVGRVADEDTTRACLHAAAVSADKGCEIDMQLTKDHVPIVMHDGTTDRVTRNCNIKIATHTWDQLKHCRMNHGDRISTLNNLVRGMSYHGHKNIVAEIKDKYVTTRELRIINSTFAHYGYGPGNLAYESFIGDHLRAMKTVAPDVPALLIDGNINNPLQASNVSSVYDGVIIPYGALVNGLRSDPDYARKWRERKNGTGELITWDTETVSQMRYATYNEVSGFMSNHIGRATELVRTDS